MKIATVFGWLAGATLAGCSALPTAGPTVRQVLHQEVEGQHKRFDVVDVDDHVVRTLLAQPPDSFKVRFKQYAEPPQPRIGIGDTLVVTIWEAASGGLFGSSPLDHITTGSHSVTIPAQAVGTDGAISVPFAGRIPVAGKTPVEVQRDVERRLAGKAIEPQALVTIAKSVTDTVTVSGEVVAGARVPLTLKGDRLLDVIAAAGGAKAPVYETFVRLSRGGVTATVPLATLVSDPAENIYARPGDVLTLIRLPQAFSVLGATGRNAEVAFGAEKLTLIEALAKAGGLQDMRSDPAGVFLFRWEPPKVAAAIGAPPLPIGPRGDTPVVFRLDMSDANAYFLAQRFPVEDKDVIYVANAQLDELQKFFSLLNTLTGPVVTGVVLKNAAP
jgi:polysaccharide biosynthesis/export protein